MNLKFMHRWKGGGIESGDAGGGLSYAFDAASAALLSTYLGVLKSLMSDFVLFLTTSEGFFPWTTIPISSAISSI